MFIYKRLVVISGFRS